MKADRVDRTAGLGGWGPERPTFTTDNPASYAAINSMVDKVQGDNRNFLQLKEKDASDSSYTDNISATLGQTYTAIVTFRNAALDPSISPARETLLRLQIPASITGAGELNAVISADNTVPEIVWDSAVIELTAADSAAAIRYIPESAVIHSRGAVNGQKLDDSVFDQGTHLGCDELNGTLDGTENCSGYVTFDFTLDHPGFTSDSLASVNEDGVLTPVVEATVGDIVTIRGEYRNTGSTQQNDVALRAVLPAGMAITNTPVLMATSKTNEEYVSLQPEANSDLTSSGINIGSYAPNEACWIIYSIQIQDIPGYDFSETGQIYRYVDLIVDTRNGSKKSTLKVLIFGQLQ